MEKNNSKYFLVIVAIVAIVAVVALFKMLGSSSSISAQDVTGNAIAMNQTNTTGNMKISSNPTGVNLYVDNVFQGATPKTVFNLKAGNHTVKATKSGYKDYTTTKYIYGGKTESLYIKLTLSQNITLTLSQNQTNTTGNMKI